MADAAEQGDVVLFEAHAGAAAVAETPAGELVLHLLAGEAQARGQPLDHDHQGAPV